MREGRFERPLRAWKACVIGQATLLSRNRLVLLFVLRGTTGTTYTTPASLRVEEQVVFTVVAESITHNTRALNRTRQMPQSEASPSTTRGCTSLTSHTHVSFYSVSRRSAKREASCFPMRGTGIEPVSCPWQGHVFPLDQPRAKVRVCDSNTGL